MNEVLCEWHKMTEFRENPCETNKKLEKFIHHWQHNFDKPENSWNTGLRMLLKKRWFLGFMTPEEIDAQETKLSLECSFFIYLSTCSGDVTMSYCGFGNRSGRIVVLHQYQTGKDWIHLWGVERCCFGKYPLDRGKALIYRKEVNRRARIGVHTWMLVAARAKIPKDIRHFIAKLIWDGRQKWMV